MSIGYWYGTGPQTGTGDVPFTATSVADVSTTGWSIASGILTAQTGLAAGVYRVAFSGRGVSNVSPGYVTVVIKHNNVDEAITQREVSSSTSAGVLQCSLVTMTFLAISPGDTISVNVASSGSGSSTRNNGLLIHRIA